MSQSDHSYVYFRQNQAHPGDVSQLLSHLAQPKSKENSFAYLWKWQAGRKKKKDQAKHIINPQSSGTWSGIDYEGCWLFSQWLEVLAVDQRCWERPLAVTPPPDEVIVFRTLFKLFRSCQCRGDRLKCCRLYLTSRGFSNLSLPELPSRWVGATSLQERETRNSENLPPCHWVNRVFSGI